MEINRIKDFFTGFFVLLVAFSYSLFFIIQTGLGLPTEGGIFQIYSGGITIVSLMLYLISIKRISDNINIIIFLICAIVILLFFATRIGYEYVNNKYQSYFLSMGVRFIPGLLTGAYMLSDALLLQKVEKALLPFICLYTIILARVIFTAQLGVNLVETFNIEGGMNYQNMSYYSIYAFGLTLYLIVNGSYSKSIRYLLILFAFLQVSMTIMTGGRGAFVLGVVFILYYGLKNLSLNRIITLCLLLIFIGFLTRIVFSDNLLFQNGFSRIFNFFSDTDAIEHDNRWIRWRLAWNAFLRSPLLGHGLGSVFYEVGFYSHNIFMDILCEGGILLFSIFLFFLYLFCKRAKYWIRIDPRHEIIVTIFLCSFVMSCFSGYYWSDSGLWFALTYMLIKPFYNQVVYE